MKIKAWKACCDEINLVFKTDIPFRKTHVLVLKFLI